VCAAPHARGAHDGARQRCRVRGAWPSGGGRRSAVVLALCSCGPKESLAVLGLPLCRTLAVPSMPEPAAVDTWAAPRMLICALQSMAARSGAARTGAQQHAQPGPARAAAAARRCRAARPGPPATRRPAGRARGVARRRWSSSWRRCLSTWARAARACPSTISTSRSRTSRRSQRRALQQPG